VDCEFLLSPYKTKRTYHRNENNALLLVKRERREGRPSSGEESGAAQRKREEQTHAEGEGASFSLRKKISTGKKELKHGHISKEISC